MPPTQAADSSYIRPDKAEDWEPYREVIAEMYRTMKLADVMEYMEKNYAFKGTVRQYKGKIKAWGLDNKYTKTAEYLEVIQDKERGDSPGPARTSSGKQISESSLNRFKKRAEKRGILPSSSSSSSSGQAAGHQGYDPGLYAEEYYYDQQGYDATTYQGYPQGGSASYGGQW